MVAGRMIPQLSSGVFRLVSTNGDPRLLAEEVTEQGEVFRKRELFPLFLVFILLLVVIS
jgi:hypothetical protein